MTDSTQSSSGASPSRSYSGKNWTTIASGVNSQGNHWDSRDYGPSVANRYGYHYSNANGSYYYSNLNGSTYYENPVTGRSVYTPPGGSSDGKGK